MEHTITKEAYEGDIVSRLRNWRGLHLAHGGELFEEAADLIESQRLLIDVQATSNQVDGERLRGDLDVMRLQREAAAGEVEKLRSRLRLADAAVRSESPTLTESEREAVGLAIDSMSGVEDIIASWSQRETAAIATLRGLLERTK